MVQDIRKIPEPSLKADSKKEQKSFFQVRSTKFRYQKEVHHPEIDIISGEDTFETKLKILSVYPLTEGIHTKEHAEDHGIHGY